MKLKYSFEMIQMDDYIAAIPIDAACPIRGFLRLNESAPEIFELLKKDISTENIVDSMASHYSSSKEELLGYVQGLIEQFSEGGLLTES